MDELCPRCKRKFLPSVGGDNDKRRSNRDGETVICSVCEIAERMEAGVIPLDRGYPAYDGEPYWKEA